ncbi:MAG TPA: DUF6112 family protein [Solirubrobacteraceae bacterium]|jgi:hypothetical protein
MSALIAASGFTFQVHPEPGRAPGAAGIQSAVNVIAVYTLLACLAGFLLGGAVWAIGGRIGNDHTATGGKIGMAIAVGVAFLTGAAAAILQFAYGLG